MKHLMRPSIGLIGRVMAILLLAVLVEFAMSTLLYERASQFSVRDDEGRRLAEHLVIAERLVAARPPPARPALATELSTRHYVMRWSTTPPPQSGADLTRIRELIVAWEPALASTAPRLRLASTGGSTHIVGGVRLPDGSWLHFRTVEAIDSLDLSGGRIRIALAVALAVMAAGGAFVGRALKPMGLLAEAADRFGAPGQSNSIDLGPGTVAETGPAEVRRVVAAFNRMQARIQRLIADRTQALAAVGHDMRTPISRLRLRAEQIGDDRLRASIQGDVGEMDAMVGSLLAFLGGEDDPEPPTLVDLAVLCATLADDGADRGRDVSYDGPDHLELRVRAQGFKRALANLVDNALHYGNAAVLLLERRAASVVIAIEDDGPGIPDEALATVLEPFVRLDPARQRDTQGLGLGLAIVARAVELEGGALRLVNRVEGGLRAEITLTA